MTEVVPDKGRGKRKRHDLTLKEKWEVYHEIESKTPYRTLMKNHNCSLGQLSNIKAHHEEIEESLDANLNSNLKRLRAAPNRDINSAVWAWFQRVTAKGIPLSG